VMGTKRRNFAPLTDLSLEELVSKDNFYRHLEETCRGLKANSPWRRGQPTTNATFSSTFSSLP
jgi:hypothetical protein